MAYQEKRRSKTHFKPVNADDDKSNDSNAEDSSMSESSGAGDAGNSETFSGAESELAATTDNYFTAAEDKDGYTTSASRRTNPFFRLTMVFFLKCSNHLEPLKRQFQENCYLRGCPH